MIEHRPTNPGNTPNYAKAVLLAVNATGIHDQLTTRLQFDATSASTCTTFCDVQLKVLAVSGDRWVAAH